MKEMWERILMVKWWFLFRPNDTNCACLVMLKVGVYLWQVGYTSRVLARLQKLSPQSNSLARTKLVPGTPTILESFMQNKANQTKEPTQDRNQTTQPIHLTHPNQPNHQPTWTFITMCMAASNILIVTSHCFYTGYFQGTLANLAVEAVNGSFPMVVETAFWFTRNFPAKVPELYNRW